MISFMFLKYAQGLEQEKSYRIILIFTLYPS